MPLKDTSKRYWYTTIQAYISSSKGPWIERLLFSGSMLLRYAAQHGATYTTVRQNPSALMKGRDRRQPAQLASWNHCQAITLKKKIHQSIHGPTNPPGSQSINRPSNQSINQIKSHQIKSVTQTMSIWEHVYTDIHIYMYTHRYT